MKFLTRSETSLYYCELALIGGKLPKLKYVSVYLVVTQHSEYTLVQLGYHHHHHHLVMI